MAGAGGSELEGIDAAAQTVPGATSYFDQTVAAVGSLQGDSAASPLAFAAAGGCLGWHLTGPRRLRAGHPIAAQTVPVASRNLHEAIATGAIRSLRDATGSLVGAAALRGLDAGTYRLGPSDPQRAPTVSRASGGLSETGVAATALLAETAGALAFAPTLRGVDAGA